MTSAPVLFFAVRLAPEAAAGLKPLLEDLRRVDPAVRVVRQDGLHVTVQFLGRVASGQVDATLAAGRAAADRLPGFELALGDLRWFTAGQRLQVIWVDARTGGGDLCRLHMALRAELEARGLSCDRREFRAHCTLARVRSPLGTSPRSQLESLAVSEASVERASFPVSELHLMRSLPADGEPNRYLSVEAFSLRR